MHKERMHIIIIIIMGHARVMFACSHCANVRIKHFIIIIIIIIIIVCKTRKTNINRNRTLSSIPEGFVVEDGSLFKRTLDAYVRKCILLVCVCQACVRARAYQVCVLYYYFKSVRAIIYARVVYRARVIIVFRQRWLQRARAFRNRPRRCLAIARVYPQRATAASVACYLDGTSCK